MYIRDLLWELCKTKISFTQVAGESHYSFQEWQTYSKVKVMSLVAPLISITSRNCLDLYNHLLFCLATKTNLHVERWTFSKTLLTSIY